MPQHQKEIEFFSGQGVVLISDIDPVTNLPVGFRHMANVSELSFSHNVDTTNFKESTSGQRQIVLRHETGKEILVALTFQSFSKENVALAVFGDTTDVAAAVGVAVTKVVQTGLIYGFGKVKVSNLVVTDTATGLITYVANQNFELDENAGSVRIFTAAEQAVSNGGSPAADIIADADDLTFTFDHEAQVQLESFTQPRIDVALRFEGLNTENSDEPVVVDIHRFNTDPLAEFSMITEEIWEGELEGTALFDPTQPAGKSKLYSVTKT